MNTTCATTATRCLACLGIAFLATLGCSNSAPKQDAVVQGSVTIDGELVRQGMVTFHPEGDGPLAYGIILKDGTYALRVGKGQQQDRDNKIFPGKYTATVAVTMPAASTQEDGVGQNLRKPSPRLSDARFSNKATSELKYEVVAGRNIINIPVERARPKEEADEGDDAESDLDEKADQDLEEVKTATTDEDQPQEVEQETENADDSKEPSVSDEEASSDTVKEEPAK